MLPRINKFQQLDVFHKPVRVVSDDEKMWIITLYPISTMQKIAVNNLVCIEIGAREGDIISFRSNQTDTYRYVTGRYPLI